jgi:hypothetical protein
MGSEAGFHRDRSQFMDARPLSQRSPLSRKPASDPISWSVPIGGCGSSDRRPPSHRSGSHPIAGDRPRVRGPADHAGRAEGRPARSGFILAHALLRRPTAGGSPPRKTPGRHQVGASVRPRVLYEEQDAEAERDGSSFSGQFLLPSAGGEEWGRGKTADFGELRRAPEGLSPPPANLITVRRSRLPYFPSRAAPERSGGAGAKPLRLHLLFSHVTLRAHEPPSTP